MKGLSHKYENLSLERFFIFEEMKVENAKKRYTNYDLNISKQRHLKLRFYSSQKQKGPPFQKKIFPKKNIIFDFLNGISFIQKTPRYLQFQI